MSAVHQLEVHEVGQAPRRHLRALPDVPSAQSAVASVAPAASARMVRRRVVALLALLAVVAGGAFLAGRAVASDAAPTTKTVVVHAGDTLSGVAARALPGMSSGDAVARLQEANNLGSSHVEAGETLVVPAS